MIKIGIYRHHKGNHDQVHIHTHLKTGGQLAAYQAYTEIMAFGCDLW